MSRQQFLRRYTSLSSAIDLLTCKRLTLLSPSTWDDGNDRHYMERYQEVTKAGSVLALCFSKAPETYHHWRVFTAGTEGVCIEFDLDELRGALPQAVRSDDVTYVEVRDIKKWVGDPDQWPFLKRYPFRDELEFRLVYSDPVPRLTAKSFDIPLTAVRRITSSPWLPQDLHDSLRAVISRFDDCGEIEIRRTTLVSNETWKRAVISDGTGGSAWENL